jgi:hypothetical protein
VKKGLEKKKLVSRPYWLLMVVEHLNFKVLEFLDHKSDLPVKVCEMIRQLKEKGVQVKFVRLDNAGDNVKFAEMVNGKEYNLKLTFEFTGARTPQRNYLVEVGFATLRGWLRATMDAVFIPEEEKYTLVR